MQESQIVNTEGFPVIYKCVQEPVVKETVVMERPRTSPPVGGASNAASKGSSENSKLGFFLILTGLDWIMNKGR